jgi:hypothetical protein
MPCQGWPNLKHSRSISFPSPPAEATSAFLHSQGNALYSRPSHTSNIEERASTWTASWLGSMLLVLRNVDITFFSQPTMDASQLGRFVERMEMHSSFNQAEVQFSELVVSIPFTQPSSVLHGSNCEYHAIKLDWQLSAMAQICRSFFAFHIPRRAFTHINSDSTIKRGRATWTVTNWLKLHPPIPRREGLPCRM